MDIEHCDMDVIRIGQMKDRIANKKEENKGKPKLRSDDAVSALDFNYAEYSNDGDSGQLLLASSKQNPQLQYIIKHEFTDCACNEYVYAKLLQAMEYHVPQTKLFQVGMKVNTDVFLTEYVVGSRFLHVVNPFPRFDEIRDKATNWKEYFSLYAFYAMTGEGDGMETPLADDGFIYRVDTTDAFPISNYQLDYAGVTRVVQGTSLKELISKQLLEMPLDTVLPVSSCDFCFDICKKCDLNAFKTPFLEPFTRIQEVSDSYIDGFLNTLFYFYPDFIGDFFKRYIKALQKQAAEYLKEKR